MSSDNAAASTQAPNRPPIQQQGTSEHTRTSAPVVGPTTAELESLNELIKFDHVYYKVTTPGGNNQTVTVVPTTTPLKEGISVSVVQPAKQSTKAKQLSLVPKVSTSELSKQQSANSTYNETDLQLPEIDLPPLDESLDHLLDLDNILTEDLIQSSTTQALLPSPAVPQVAATPQTTLSSGYNFVSKDTLQVPKLSQNSRKRKCSTDLNLKSITFQQRNQRHMSDDIFGLDDSSITSSDALSPRSDSSFLGSPQSDSSLLGEDGWEESFTELFPTLV